MTTVTISLKVPAGMAAMIDARTANRSDFLRKAVEEKIERDKKARKGGFLERVRSGNCSGGLSIKPLLDHVGAVHL